LFAPIHTDDVASAVGKALDSQATSGAFNLSGQEELSLRGILDLIEKSTGQSPGATSGKSITLDYLYDFIYGTASDLNMSRMVEHLEANTHLS
jgi:nucleoside-diphosphate-sugar epimerase